MKKVTDEEYKELKVLHSKMHGLYEQYKNTVNEIQDKIIDLIEEELTPVIDEFNENVSDLQNQVDEIYGQTESYIDTDKGEQYLEWSYDWNVQFTELDHIEVDVPLEEIDIYDLPSQNPNE